MGLFDKAQVRRMVAVFREHFQQVLRVKTAAPGYTLMLSDYAQAFHVARAAATKAVRLTPEVERQFIDDAIRYVLPITRAEYGAFVEAVNIKLLARNPKSDAHSRELRERMAELDAADVARRRAERT